MGLTRLLLSLLVVGSHFGNLGEPIGGTAVASFFTISGFLMARTIRENYAGAAGVRRFYLNRAVRIVPPFIAVLLLTALVLSLRDLQPFQITRGGEVMLPDTEFPPVWWKTVVLDPDPYPRFLSTQVFLAPQTWSLVVEAVFYLAAPLLVALAVPRGRVVLWAIALPSLVLALLSVPPAGNAWLRSPVDSVWVFILGVMAYDAAARLGARGERRWIAGLPVIGIVAIALRYIELPEHWAQFAAPLLAIAWLVLGGWAVRRGGRFDRTLGNLAYGVFVGHFLSALLLLWVAEAVYRTTGVFPFGEHALTTLSERVWRGGFYGAALILAVVIYYGLERPLERLRAKLRRPAAAAAVAPAQSPVVSAPQSLS
jgi:peptidoglycan/LPS O-acetylase OafA/YrhL